MFVDMSDKHFPLCLLWLQCICFSLLYAIWILPETILIRHCCLIIGALIGLIEIYYYRKSFFHRHSIFVWILFSIFIWATIHLLFLGQDFQEQLREFYGTWKRTALAALFALGFGLALINSCFSHKKAILFWWLMYFGLLAPSIIYLIKFFLTKIFIFYDLNISSYWLIEPRDGPYYLQKANYVCFCIPIFSIALGQIYKNIQKNLLVSWSSIAYLATLILVMFIFYTENIKNGMAYSFILVIIFLVAILRKGVINQPQKLIFLLFILLISSYYSYQHIQSNKSWKNFLADFRVAVQTDKYVEWRYGGGHGFPYNELGEKVSVTNYERISWAKKGFDLLLENPFGYGLIEASFGRLAKSAWPDSTNLMQTHSGWVDLALALGFPGLVIIIGPMVLIIINLLNVDGRSNEGIQKIKFAAFWALLSLALLWCTTEASQKNLFDQLIFWIAFGSGLIIRRQAKHGL